MNNIKCLICGYENEKSILSHIRNVHSLSSTKYRMMFPKSRTRNAWLSGKTKETSITISNLALINKKNRTGKPSNATIETWSRKYKKCKKCGSSRYKHASNGVCHNCHTNLYHKDINSKLNTERQKNGIRDKDYVICEVCNKPFQVLSENGHLRVHKLTVKQYLKRFPSANLTCSSVRDDISKGVSIGRITLHNRRGYLNPKSQRDKKRKELVKRYESHSISRISKLEGTFARWLQEQGFEVKMGEDQIDTDGENVIHWQYNWKNIYSFDFAHLPSKTCIEVMGDWWHGWDAISGKRPIQDLHPVQQKYIKSDINRTKRIHGDGWNIVLVWEHDIKAKNWPLLPFSLSVPV